MKTSLNSVERHYSSRFRASQMVAAIFGTGALFGSALLTAHILNAGAENYVGDALKHGLDDISHRVAMAVENDFMKHDIQDNLGDLESWADQRGPNYVGFGETLDTLFVVDADGVDIAHFPPDAETPAHLNGLFDVEPVSSVVGSVPRSGLVALDGQLAAYGLASLHDRPTIGDPADLTVVGIVFLTDDNLNELAQLVDVPELDFVLATEPLPSSDHSIQISNISGEGIGRLSWPGLKPGNEILARLAPFYLAVSVVMTIISFFMKGWYHQLIQSILSERERVKKAAETDSLTGLLNRAGVSALVEKSEIREALGKGTCALLYLDVNGFKRLNDSMGHDCGDQALSVLADRLTGASRKGDIVARLGGDEFMALIFDDEPEKAARKVCARIRKRAAVPVKIGDEYLVINAAMGVAISEPNLSWSDLLLRADAAMYQANMTMRSPKSCSLTNSRANGTRSVWSKIGFERGSKKLAPPETPSTLSFSRSLIVAVERWPTPRLCSGGTIRF